MLCLFEFNSYLTYFYGFRHAVFAPSQFDIYVAAGFPGLSDLLYKYDDLEGEEKMNREEEIKRHISDLTIMTERAVRWLQEGYQI